MNLDLNLLRVFDALMRERKVAAAALRLGLTAPAVSNALARLRRATGDELFTRTPAGMLPTAHAAAVAPAVADALAALEQGLVRPQPFVAAHSARRFRIAMTDIGEIIFLPALVHRLRELAPQVTLSTVRNAAIDLRAEMAQGGVDLAVGWLPRLGAGFHQRRLFTQRYVALMAAGHPLAQGRLTAPRFVQARHAVVVSEGSGHEQVQHLLRRHGVAEPVALRLPHFVAVPYIVAESDLVVTVPEKLAHKAAAPFGLVQRELPLALPRFEVNVFWHRRAHRDAGNRWLRELFVQLFAEERTR
ncbi:LysR family transcriptional regulator [Pseudorhodoferax sp.]|uniref:LysR family transcriptional regulator n=1 Tax=Pseudorhodoferax sp. TaxID=1993553 RepID=UPI002DD6455E|nr:LysR family transcriptional regulator [Pseudorhodoferax sp.]